MDDSPLQREIKETKRRLFWRRARNAFIVVSMIAILLALGITSGVLPKLSQDVQTTVQSYVATFTPTPTDTSTPTPTPTITLTPTPSPVDGVATGNVYVHEWPDFSSPTLSPALRRNESVAITGFVEGWYRIKWGSGEGWVQKKWIGIPGGNIPENLHVTSTPDPES